MINNHLVMAASCSGVITVRCNGVNAAAWVSFNDWSCGTVNPPMDPGAMAGIWLLLSPDRACVDNAPICVLCKSAICGLVRTDACSAFNPEMASAGMARKVLGCNAASDDGVRLDSCPLVIN